MFEVEASVRFSFTHSLEGFGEEVKDPHHHDWDVTITLGIGGLDGRGVGADFIKLGQELKKLLEPYQKKNLNESDLPFVDQPTAEHIALWVAEQMDKLYPGLVVRVSVGTDEERVRFIVPDED